MRYLLALSLFGLVGLSTPVAVAQVLPSLEQPSGLLTVDDVPSGFRELPPPVGGAIVNRVQNVTRFLDQTSLRLNRSSVFVNPDDLQLIMGLTGNLSSQPEQLNFDSFIRQLQTPQVQRQFLSLLRRNTLELQQVQVLDYQPLAGLNEIANSSTGMRLTVQLRDRVWRMDVVVFRRSSVGALAAVVYPQQVTAPVGVEEFARKLDARVVQVVLR